VNRSLIFFKYFASYNIAEPWFVWCCFALHHSSLHGHGSGVVNGRNFLNMSAE
jgi:hypothetical protein